MRAVNRAGGRIRGGGIFPPPFAPSVYRPAVTDRRYAASGGDPVSGSPPEAAPVCAAAPEAGGFLCAFSGNSPFMCGGAAESFPPHLLLCACRFAPKRESCAGLPCIRPSGLHLTGALIRPAVQGFGVHTLFPCKAFAAFSGYGGSIAPPPLLTICTRCALQKRRIIGVFTKLLPKYMCKMQIVI